MYLSVKDKVMSLSFQIDTESCATSMEKGEKTQFGIMLLDDDCAPFSPHHFIGNMVKAAINTVAFDDTKSVTLVRLEATDEYLYAIIGDVCADIIGEYTFIPINEREAIDAVNGLCVANVTEFLQSLMGIDCGDQESYTDSLEIFKDDLDCGLSIGITRIGGKHIPPREVLMFEDYWNDFINGDKSSKAGKYKKFTIGQSAYC